jgi:hypothetical protein
MTDADPEPRGDDDDDEEARRLRAERLRARIEGIRGGNRAPPRTPREFADQAAIEQAKAARDRLDEPGE